MRRTTLALAALLLVSGCSTQPPPAEPASAPPVTSAAPKPSASPKAVSESSGLSVYEQCIQDAAAASAEFYEVDPSILLENELVLAACEHGGPFDAAEFETPGVATEEAPAEAPVDLDALYAECIESNASMAADMNGGTVEEWRADPAVVEICEGQVAFEEATQ